MYTTRKRVVQFAFALILATSAHARADQAETFQLSNAPKIESAPMSLAVDPRITHGTDQQMAWDTFYCRAGSHMCSAWGGAQLHNWCCSNDTQCGEWDNCRR